MFAAILRYNYLIEGIALIAVFLVDCHVKDIIRFVSEGAFYQLVVQLGSLIGINRPLF
jgi:hypothetical protein